MKAEIINPKERDLVKRQLDRLQIEPSSLVLRLVDYIETRKISPDLQRRVFELIETDDSVGALLVLSRNDEAVIPRTPSRDARKSQKLVDIKSRGGTTVMVSEPPSAFPLGTAAHRIRERLELVGDIRALFDSTGSELMTEKNQVIGMKFSLNDKVGSQYVLFSTKEERIDFEVPIPSPTKNEPMADWLHQRLKDSFERLGALPSKPYEVEKIFKDQKRREALVTIVELCHIIFGNSSAMSATVDQEGKRYVGAKTISEFQALNWLSIAEAVLTKSNEPEKDGEKGIMVELAIGRIKIATDEDGDGVPEVITVQGGEVDTMIVEIPDIGEGERNIGIMSMVAEGEFGRQKIKYRRQREDGSDAGGKLGRNLKSYLWLLAKEYGEEMLKELKITIIDYKFLCGDGGMWKIINRDNLPIDAHIEQVKNYILLTLCQIYMIYQNEIQGGGKPYVMETIDINEVIDFAVSTDLVGRVVAQLDYLVPGNKVLFEVVAKDGEELRQWGREYITKKLKVFPEHRKRHILETLSQVMWEGHELETIIRRSNHPPESIKDWCLNYEGHNYLCLEELKESLLNGENLQIQRAVNYKGGVVVVWVRSNNFDGEVRIAFNKNGQFRIRGLPDVEGAVVGSLTSSLNLMAVSENSPDLWENVETDFWPRLQEILLTKGHNLCLTESEWAQSNSIIGPDGYLSIYVHDKALICSFDPMVGIWRVDKKLLEGALSELGERDPYHIRVIGKILEENNPIKQQNIMCPRPDHPNKNTEAATIHPDGHIHCYVCGTTMTERGVKTGEGGNRQTLPMGDSPNDYRSVSKERNLAVGSYVQTAERLGHMDETLKRYLESRGLEISDMKGVGYVPLEVSKFLSKLVTQAKRTEKETSLPIFGWKHIKSLTVNQFIEMLGHNDCPQHEWLEKVRDGMEIPREYLMAVWNSVSLGELAEWRRRGLVGEDKTGGDYMGGRLIVPTVWPGEKKLLYSNVNGRGVTLDGESLYENMDHRKAFLAPGKEGKRPLPPGVWLPDAEEFLTNVSDTVVVLEGAITAASFWKLEPGWDKISIAGMGLPKYQLLAFLKWLGIDGYDSKEHASFGLHIKRVILGMDFDWGGAKGYQDIKNVLEVSLPKLEVLPIQDVLKGTIVEPYIRSYDLEDYVEGGRYYGLQKIDFNDILKELLRIKQIRR